MFWGQKTKECHGNNPNCLPCPFFPLSWTEGLGHNKTCTLSEYVIRGQNLVMQTSNSTIYLSVLHIPAIY